MPREILLNAFDMNCVGHIQQGLWRHPDDQSTRYLDIHYWTELARTLEAALFDGLFLADMVGVYDVYGNADAALRGGVQVPVNDPMLLTLAMAAATTHLGFGVTANLGRRHPPERAPGSSNSLLARPGSCPWRRRASGHPPREQRITAFWAGLP